MSWLKITIFDHALFLVVHPIMVMEYYVRGDLLGYLRKSRGIHDKYHLGQGSISELEIYDLVLFAKQIAAGMVFLGSRGVSNLLQKIKIETKFHKLAQ